MSCKYKGRYKGPGMADVKEVTVKTLHGRDYAKTPEDIVKNIMGKKEKGD